MSKIMRGLYESARRPLLRYSSREDDADGYRNFQNAKNAGRIPVVYLDGELVDKVIMADEERGEVTKYIDPFQIIEGELMEETLHGVVTVELKDAK